MSTQTSCLYPCADGPLRGELHYQGPQFVFDGRQAGLERGSYTLEDGQYRWHPDSAQPTAR